MRRTFGQSFTISATLVFPVILFMVSLPFSQTVKIIGAGQNCADDLCHGSQTDRQGGAWSFKDFLSQTPAPPPPRRAPRRTDQPLLERHVAWQTLLATQSGRGDPSTLKPPNPSRQL